MELLLAKADTVYCMSNHVHPGNARLPRLYLTTISVTTCIILPRTVYFLVLTVARFQSELKQGQRPINKASNC